MAFEGMEYYPKHICEEINRIRFMDQSKVAIVTIFKDLVEAFKRHNIISDQQVFLKPEQVMCHMKNRGGLGLNGHNVHENARKVDLIGADSTFASKMAYAFQMHPSIDKRRASLLFNVNLVAASQQLLAPLFHCETHESVGGGHMVGWVRAVKSGKCKTPIKEFQNDSGFIDYARVTKDRQMKIMVEEGYYWWEIPWQVGDAFPNVPDIFQKALNAFNTVSSDSSELEVAVTIGTLGDQCTPPVDWGQCILAATSANPPCKDYAATLMMLARDYGGGHGMPELKRLDAVAKKWSSNRKLGATMLKEILDANFDRIEKFPLVRLGIILAALTSPKLALDGTAGLYLPSDIRKLFKKQHVLRIVEAIIYYYYIYIYI
jgi:hypothetical protein